MSNQPDNDLFNLENLFAPAWAKEPTTANRYAKYEGRDEIGDRPERRGDRPRFGGPRREGGPRPPRGPGGERMGGPRRDSDRDRRGPGRGGPRREGRGPAAEPRERAEPPPLPEVNIALVPDATGVDLLAKQIKMTGRAYPLFQIAQMILERPERHAATFSVKKKPDGTVAQPLFGCALDDLLWLSEDEVVRHVLKQHLATFYQAERTQTEPPKGKYTFVAQCGLSGVILGPPNHHDYQRKLQELHSSRFSRMPFEAFKARVKIVRDEAVVAKWIEEQSWKTEYICLNVPESPRLGSLEDVENHFRAVHAATIIKPIETITLGGRTCRNLRCAELARLYRQAVEQQRRFPLQLATVLSQQFAQHGLQFFKVNKTLTHVWVARPKYLDLETTPVSDQVKRIVEFINGHPKCTRRDLIEALAPTPVTPIPVNPPAPEGAPAEAAGGASAGEAAAVPAPAAPAEPTPEQTAIIADLHWLIHQGHVIEFATTGILETAKKPAPKPPKPEPKAASPADAGATGGGEVAASPAPESSPASEPAPAPEPASEPTAVAEAAAPSPSEPSAEPPKAEAAP